MSIENIKESVNEGLQAIVSPSLTLNDTLALNKYIKNLTESQLINFYKIMRHLEYGQQNLLLPKYKITSNAVKAAVKLKECLGIFIFPYIERISGQIEGVNAKRISWIAYKLDGFPSELLYCASSATEIARKLTKLHINKIGVLCSTR